MNKSVLPRILILPLVALQFLISLRFPNLYSQPNMVSKVILKLNQLNGNRENNNREVISANKLSRLSVKELKNLATKFNNGNPSKRSFIEKQELIDYVYGLQLNLRKQTAILSTCGRCNIDEASQLYKFGKNGDGSKFKEFVTSGSELLLIWYTNSEFLYINQIHSGLRYIYSKKNRRELAHKFCGLFKFVIIHCANGDSMLSKECHNAGLKAENGLTMILPGAKECACSMNSFGYDTTKSEIEVWIRSLMADRNSSNDAAAIECPLTFQPMKTKSGDNCLHKISCKNKVPAKPTAIFCPTISTVEAICDTLTLLCIILLLTYLDMTKTLSIQFTNAALAIVFNATILAPTIFALARTQIERLCLESLCKSAVWMDLWKCVFAVSGQENVIIILESRWSRFVHSVCFLLLVFVQNRLVCRIFKLKADRTEHISLIWYLPMHIVTESLRFIKNIFYCWQWQQSYVASNQTLPTRRLSQNKASNINRERAARDVTIVSNITQSRPQTISSRQYNVNGENLTTNNDNSNTTAVTPNEILLPVIRLPQIIHLQQPFTSSSVLPAASTERLSETGIRNYPQNVAGFRSLTIRDYIIQSITQNIFDSQCLQAAKEVFDETVAYSNETVEKCSICLNEIVKGDRIYEIKCRHTYHAECLRTLVFDYNLYTCPNCRQIIRDADD